MAIDIFQIATTLEGLFTNAGYAVGDGDGGQAAATIKGHFADARHAVGDGDGGQAAATREGRVTDAGHASRDDSSFTSNYQIVGLCLNNRITIVARVIFRISCIHGNCY